MSENIDDYMAAIGRRIRRIREAKGQKMTIAHEIRTRYNIKIDPSYLSRMERGKVEIPLRTLYALADFFDISLARLIDPELTGNATGVEFLFADRDLLNSLVSLKEILGDNGASQQIKLFIQQILDLITEKPARGIKIRAAHPATQRTKKSQKEL